MGGWEKVKFILFSLLLWLNPGDFRCLFKGVKEYSERGSLSSETTLVYVALFKSEVC